MAKGEAPPARHSVEDIVAAGRLRRRRALTVRLGGAGAVAAAMATVAVLVAVNLTVPGGQSGDKVLPPAVVPPSPTAPPPSPPFTFTFAGYRVGDYRVLAPDEVNLAYQTAAVMRDVKDAKGKTATKAAGTLTVYQPKLFDPVRARFGAAPATPGEKIVTAYAVAWQYAPDAWAVLESELPGDADGFPVADRVKIADRFAVRAGEPRRARLPFRTGYLPAGFTLRSISGQSMTAENRGMVTFVYAKPQPPATMPPTARDRAADRTVTSVAISILWVDTPPKDAVKRVGRCNSGQHWCMKTLTGGEFWLEVEDPSKALPDQELLRIADHLTFATIKDASTWYPVA